jgi:Flp pilus assembly protein TadG
MTTTENPSESGQVMVFLVIAVVVLLGFAALAIDGGMVYSDRRHAQNASDAASLAGGAAAALTFENEGVTYSNWNCSSSGVLIAEQDAINGAIDRAASNDFTIDDDLADANGVTTTCGETDMGGYTDKHLDITVNISSTTDTAFAHFVYNGPLRNQVEAVTRVRPRSPLAYGHAIVALNDADCSGNQNGAIFGGSSEVTVNGGGIWTNGCLRGTGGAYDVSVTGGSVNYAGMTSGTMNFDPPETNVPDSLPPSSYAVPTPDCSDPSAHNVVNLTLHNGTLDLSPGLWCVSGQVRINGGTFTGTGITIYLPTGDVTISGNADVSLASAGRDPDPSPAIAGVLFYVAEGDVDLEGNNDSNYLGLVYAPNGTIKARGTSGTEPTFHTQFIGWNVDVSGNANIDINFDMGEEYTKPAAIELYK